MHGLRTVTVLEHEVIPIVEGDDGPGGLAGGEPWLSAAEVQGLLRLNEIRPGFCQPRSVGVKLAQYCGVVRLPTCVVEVLPKVGMADARAPDELKLARGALLTMLHSARNVAITKIGPVPQQAGNAPLLDIFIEAFLHCALEQARRGLLSRYVQHVDDLPVIKGRFQIHGHVRRNLARPHLLHCEYDEFTADNVYNRAIRATLDACRTWCSRAATQKLWFETHARYAGVSSVKMSAADVVRLPRDRTTRRYAAVLTWCEWLLSMASPALSAGASQAPGLLFDMNRLFEAHVTSLEEACAGDTRIVQTQGPSKYLASRGLTGVFLMKPDITVWHIGLDGSASGIDRVVDAKWKRLDLSARDFGVSAADVYQVLAYSVGYGCKTLELVYPMPAWEGALCHPPVFDIPVNYGGSERVQVRLKLIPLWK